MKIRALTQRRLWASPFHASISVTSPFHALSADCFPDCSSFFSIPVLEPLFIPHALIINSTAPDNIRTRPSNPHILVAPTASPELTTTIRPKRSNTWPIPFMYRTLDPSLAVRSILNRPTAHVASP